MPVKKRTAKAASQPIVTLQLPTSLTITLRIEHVPPKLETPTLPFVGLPAEVRAFCDLESEPFAREQMYREAHLLYPALKDWRVVLADLSRRYGTPE